MVTFRRSKSAGMAWLAVEQDREKFVIYGTDSQIANFVTLIRDALPAETQEDPVHLALQNGGGIA